MVPKVTELTTESPLTKENIPLLPIHQSIDMVPSFNDTEESSLYPPNEAYAPHCASV